MKRRRFITLAAGFACAPRLSVAQTWQGRALGAEVSVRIEGPRDLTRQALADLPGIIAGVEAAFSLFRPDSELSRLNRQGGLRAPSQMMRAVLGDAARANRLTGGLFDPTVQPLWQALALGGDTAAAQALIGWERVSLNDAITLEHGQALTLNGIAQGYATDLVVQRLVALGARQALVDLGEQAAVGGPFRLGLSDPSQGVVGWRTLRDGAVATSSPGALRLGAGQGHILAPDGRAPLWSTLSIEAPSAALADALSTAAVFMDPKELARLKSAARLGRIIAVSDGGRVLRI
ncbi:FAD:protein FMN transferase [Puniceibacterium confluentis]|uniref:FAD:protein FMN transferase n=1 Tax=Puniceibacterium confluentis TaxID=1958944 RepID=UPI0011B7A989|nr:FAD:protein FMN transferase [Puniceibacterium confluentis]